MGDWGICLADRRDPWTCCRRIKKHRREHQHHHNYTGRQGSEGTAKRYVHGRRLRSLLALYGTGRAQFLRATRRSGWMPVARWGMPAPVLGADDAVVRGRLGHGVSDLTMTRRQYGFNYPFPPADVVEFFQQYYGPTNRAFASLGESDVKKLRADLEALWSSH